MKKIIIIKFLLFLCICSFGQTEIDRKGTLEEVVKEKTKGRSNILPFIENGKFNKEKYDNYIESSTTSENKIKVRNEGETKLTENDALIRSEAEPFIAINPTNTDNIVVAFMEIGQGLQFPIYFTNDGGDTWTKSSFDPISVFQEEFPDHTLTAGGDPVLTFDADGKLYFSWIIAGALIDENWDIMQDWSTYWAYSEDNGASFISPESPDNLIIRGELNAAFPIVGPNGNGIWDREWFDTDMSDGPFRNSLYCSGLFVPSQFSNWDGEGIALRYKRENEGAFEDGVTIVTEVDAQFGNVRVDGSGNVHVSYAWFGSDFTSPGTIMHSVSTDGGVSFSEPVEVGSFLFTVFNTLVHRNENPAPSMVVDRNTNDIYIVWSTFETPNPNALPRAVGYFSKSTDLGATWSNPIDISTFTSSFQTQCLMPALAIDNKTGAISISAYMLNIEDKGHYVVLESKDGGDTFAEPLAASKEPADFQKYDISLDTTFLFFGDYNTSVRTECETHSVWADARGDTGSKLYFATTSHCDPSGILEKGPITDKIAIKALFPNPTSNASTLNLELKESSSIQIDISNIQGRHVKAFDKQDLSSGAYSIELDVSDIPSGTYGVTIRTHFGVFTKKLVIVQ